MTFHENLSYEKLAENLLCNNEIIISSISLWHFTLIIWRSPHNLEIVPFEGETATLFLGVSPDLHMRVAKLILFSSS